MTCEERRLRRPRGDVSAPVTVARTLILVSLLLVALLVRGAPVLSENDEGEVDNRGERLQSLSNEYQSADAIDRILDDFALTYPGYATIIDIGLSFEQRRIRALHIHGNFSEGAPRRERTLILGGQHAREWISPAAVLLAMRRILENVSTNAFFALGHSFVFIPLFNPDGYAFSRRCEDYEPSTTQPKSGAPTTPPTAAIDFNRCRDYRLWRKNRSITDNSTDDEFCQGVDLNRNWEGPEWGQWGVSQNSCDNTYNGEFPFSEPETFAFQEWFLKEQGKEALKVATGRISESFVASIDFHNWGQMILREPGWITRKDSGSYHVVLEENESELEAAGNDMIQAIWETSLVVYRNIISYELYPVSGSSLAFLSDQLVNPRLAFTVELGDDGEYGFLMPESEIWPSSNDVLAILSALASNVVSDTSSDNACAALGMPCMSQIGCCLGGCVSTLWGPPTCVL